MGLETGRTRLACMLAAAGLLACAGGEQGGEAATSEMASAAVGADTVTLSPKNESGLSGSVTLTEDGDSITLAVTLEGGTPGATYASHIHNGTCDAPGGVAAPLSGITVTEDSAGMATTTVAANVVEGEEAEDPDAAEDTEAGESEPPLLVLVHLPGGTPAACAEIN